MATEGKDFPLDERFTSFKTMLDLSANNLKIAFHPDCSSLLVPLMKRAELVMADYEEWITSGGTSIVLSPTALEQSAGAASADPCGPSTIPDGALVSSFNTIVYIAISAIRTRAAGCFI